MSLCVCVQLPVDNFIGTINTDVNLEAQSLLFELCGSLLFPHSCVICNINKESSLNCVFNFGY